jgi:hypothetical protein
MCSCCHALRSAGPLQEAEAAASGSFNAARAASQLARGEVSVWINHPVACTLPLYSQGLLREGREATEQLLQLPVFPPPNASSGGSQGQLIVRLVSVGRAPAGAAPGTFDDAGAFRPASPGRQRVRVRAAPYQPGSPAAAELRSASGSSGPLADLWGRVSSCLPALLPAAHVLRLRCLTTTGQASCGTTSTPAPGPHPG